MEKKLGKIRSRTGELEVEQYRNWREEGWSERFILLPSDPEPSAGCKLLSQSCGGTGAVPPKVLVIYVHVFVFSLRKRICSCCRDLKK